MDPTYRVVRYPADDHSEPERVVASGLTHTRAVAVADRLFGSYVDEDGQQCFHASMAEGCGGYCIELEEAASPPSFSRRGAVPLRSIIVTIIKKCNCGQQYSLAEFCELEYLGVQYDAHGVAVLELRNCVCGSTIAHRIRGQKCTR